MLVYFPRGDLPLGKKVNVSFPYLLLTDAILCQNLWEHKGIVRIIKICVSSIKLIVVIISKIKITTSK